MVIRRGITCGWAATALILAPLIHSKTFNLTVDFSSDHARPLPHYWAATGWCPPEPMRAMPFYFNSESSLQNHATIASIPNGGIRTVRIHDLLYMLRVPEGSDPERLEPSALNFSLLDRGLDILNSSGLAVGFELMGNPLFQDRSDDVGVFTDWRSASQLASWESMVRAIAEHYIDRYGIEAVRTWRFEAWNEPDHACSIEGKMKAGIACDLDSWVGYMRSSANGLRKADPELIFGGPGSGGATLSTDFLEATVSLVFNASEPRIDFIQWHKKGIFSDGAKDSLVFDKGVVDEILQRTVAHSATKPSRVPIGNEEVDVEGGWNKVFAWRGDLRYPAAMARSLLAHQHAFRENETVISSLDYSYHANDNAFLNYGDQWFDQRTLTVRFEMNETGAVEVLRKASANLMAMLSLLGDTKHSTRGVPNADTNASVPLGAISTSRTRPESGRYEIAALLFNSNGTSEPNDCAKEFCNATLRVDMRGAFPGVIPRAAGRVAARLYRMSSIEGDIKATWEAMGGRSNPYPSAEQFKALRLRMELPVIDIEWPAEAESVEIQLPQPGVALVHVCAAESSTKPQRVEGLRARVTPTQNPPEVLLSWSDVEERCIKTYEVDFSRDTTAASWTRVNQYNDTIFTAFLHAQVPPGPPLGCYRVRAVDYWGTFGDYSDVVCVNK